MIFYYLSIGYEYKTDAQLLSQAKEAGLDDNGSDDNRSKNPIHDSQRRSLLRLNNEGESIGSQSTISVATELLTDL
jgi:hypothetical protein